MNSFDSIIPTNSFAHADFSILSMDGVDEPMFNLEKLKTMDLEECYFSTAINFLKEINESYVDSKIKLYKAIAENSSDLMILESFSDYYVQVEAIVSKFLKFLRNKLDSFFETMEHFIAENSTLKEHKKALIEDIKYYQDDSTEGFNYTINEDIPDMGAVDKFNASLFDDLFKSNITDLNADAVKDTVTSIELEEDFRRFRARILGMDGELSESEFIKTIYMIFRDNNGTAIELNIDAAKIRKIAEDYFKFSEIKSNLNKAYNDIETAYDKVLKKISIVSKNNNNLTIGAFSNILPHDAGVDKIDGKTVDNDGMMMSSNMMLQFDIYSKAKADQLQKYTDITMMAIAAKMDAIKSMYRQNTNILLNVCEVLDHPESYYDALKKGGEF